VFVPQNTQIRFICRSVPIFASKRDWGFAITV
jgi:hypothetical protein